MVQISSDFRGKDEDKSRQIGYKLQVGKIRGGKLRLLFEIAEKNNWGIQNRADTQFRRW